MIVVNKGSVTVPIETIVNIERAPSRGVGREGGEKRLTASTVGCSEAAQLSPLIYSSQVLSTVSGRLLWRR